MKLKRITRPFWRHALLSLLAAVPVLASASTPEAEAESHRLAFQRPATIPFPKDNLYTPEKAALGKMLFFDARLSRDQNISCASCHNPSFGWKVPFAKAIGAGGQPLPRNAPTTINLAWNHNFFWDGRADSLESQAKGPIESKLEMDLPMATLVTRLKAVSGYQNAFSRAFPADGITELTALKAIATYERTVVTPDTPFDRWVAGDRKALSASAVRGFALFNGKAQCAACHTGWNFTDDKFHDIGGRSPDVGRSAISKNPADGFAMKTSSLREIASRAPYMHDGSLDSLEAVVAHYMTGGVDRPTRSPLIKPLALSGDDVVDLVAFMKSLSSPNTVLALPNLPAR